MENIVQSHPDIKERKRKPSLPYKAVWIKQREAKLYCQVMASVVDQIPSCRRCKKAKHGRDCRGNHVGTLDIRLSRVEEAFWQENFKLEPTP